MFKSKFKTLFLSFSITLMAASLISYPKESFEASISGLNMWWGIVFPSLLPFFIVSELLIGFGVVNFLGVLLEPLMRPLFKVPGAGGFVWAMGMASGYPAGAKLTARLRQEGHLTQIEAERLVSFTNSSNPLFIFGAVAVGFFHTPELGVIFALSHYLGNICVGLIMRFYGKDGTDQRNDCVQKFKLRYAFSVLHHTRMKENRPLGKLLGDAVTSSIQTLLMIGGFIILFSVVNRLLYHLHVTDLLADLLKIVLSSLTIPQELSVPLISGLFEITLGSKLTSEVHSASILHQVMITSFILGFSGFSVQAQVASILAQTDIRFQPFFIARFIHGILASLFVVILWNPLLKNGYRTGHGSEIIPVFILKEHPWTDYLYQTIIETGPLITISALGIYVITLAFQLKSGHK